MAKNLKRKIQQMFRVDENELDLIRQKMESANIINKEAYYRKMVLDGYIVRLDLSEIRKMIALLSNYTNNLNQIAKRANISGNIYESDISDIRESQERLWGQVEKILRGFANIGT